MNIGIMKRNIPNLDFFPAKKTIATRPSQPQRPWASTNKYIQMRSSPVMHVTSSLIPKAIYSNISEYMTRTLFPDVAESARTHLIERNIKKTVPVG